MSMNSPKEPVQPQMEQPVQQVDASTLESAAPVISEEPQVVADGAPVEEAQQGQPQEEQVIEAVAQGLADEEITAADIMTAVLSDSLGISPAGAQSLFQILMSELVDDVQEDTAPVEQSDVPPTEM